MRPWRDAASLILAARNTQHSTKLLPSACNYKLLCVRRNEKMKFMPGSYVFPGGTADSADADLKWKHLFSSFGFSSDSFAALLPNATRRPGIFDTQPNNALPKEVSLRITAIRETFEECGVLLCKQIKDAGENAKWASHLVENELRDWQTKVHEDAKHFYVMCEELKCYPDLWSLYEWSNWLTPTFYKRRFDTVFFMACMSSIPQTTYDISELDDLRWDMPKNLLRGDIPLPTPQMHDILQIGKFDSIEDLLKIAGQRNKLGTQRIMPVIVQVNDGLVGLLPSDSLYPEEVSLIKPQVINKAATSIVELRAGCPAKKRAEYYNFPKVTRLLTENCENADDYLSPEEFELANGQLNNKL